MQNTWVTSLDRERWHVTVIVVVMVGIVVTMTVCMFVEVRVAMRVTMTMHYIAATMQNNSHPVANWKQLDYNEMPNGMPYNLHDIDSHSNGWDNHHGVGIDLKVLADETHRREIAEERRQQPNDEYWDNRSEDFCDQNNGK